MASQARTFAHICHTPTTVTSMASQVRGLPSLCPRHREARFHGLADAKSPCADLQPLDAAAADVVDSAHNLALP